MMVPIGTARFDRSGLGRAKQSAMAETKKAVDEAAQLKQKLDAAVKAAEDKAAEDKKKEEAKKKDDTENKEEKKSDDKKDEEKKDGDQKEPAKSED